MATYRAPSRPCVTQFRVRRTVRFGAHDGTQILAYSKRVLNG